MSEQGATMSAQDKVEAAKKKPEKRRTINRVETFTLANYLDRDSGEVLSATLVSEFPGGEGESVIARLVANEARVAWDHLPLKQQQRFWMLARVMVYIKDLPKWVQKWMYQDDELLATLYSQTEAHRVGYLQRRAETGRGDQVVTGLAVTPIGADPLVKPGT